MELHDYKWPQPAVVDGWQLHPLPPTEFEQATRQTTAWAERTGAAAWAAHLEMCVQLVARAAGADPIAVRCLKVSTLVALVRAWLRVQAASLPDPDRLEAILRLGVVDDPLTKADGAVANHAPTAAEFYGLPLVSLTMGQLLYYWTLRSCFREMHVEKDGKRYSRKWLQQKAQEARARPTS